MNRHQQILKVLQSGGRALDPRDFKLYVHGLALEARTWAAAQELNPGGTLELRMKIPELETVVNVDPLSDSTMQDRAAKSSAISQNNFELHRLDPTPVIEPFLKWTVLDEYGVREMGSAVSRMDRFLWKIYEGLPAESFREKYPTSTKLLVMGSTPHDLQSVASRLSHQELFQKASRLWHYFVSPDATALAPVQLFWGLLDELYQAWKSFNRDYSRITDLLGEINAFADQIHLGVHFRESKIDPDMPMRNDNRDTISASSILLNSIVDTLIAVYQMLISAVRATRHDAEGKKECMQSAVSYGNEALWFLRAARDDLIAEANDILHTATASVVPSPEGLVIMLMERLVSGVLDRGTVDVLRMYSACFEHLVSQPSIKCHRDI